MQAPRALTGETPKAPADDAPALRPAPLWHRVIAGTIKLVLPLAILAAGAWAARDIYLSAPSVQPGAPERAARLVAVAVAEPARRGPLIEAWGTVAPARVLALGTEVTGRVVGLRRDLTQGGIVAQGAELIRLDDQEQRLALAEAEAQISEIQAEIAIEEGQATRAERDLSRLTDRLTDEQRALVLRKPQMAALEARLAAAVAAREAAAVALSKTRVHAPFDAVVMEETVALGSILNAGTQAARLIAADRFRVTLVVPPSALDWIDPGAGQTIALTQPGVWPEGTSRQGRILRLDPGLTETGRMAEIIAEVDDPLARRPETDGPALLIGSFLRAEIAGREIAGAVVVDRAWLRDGDTVWVMGAEDRLEIRPVAIAWRGAREVLVTDGLSPGERIVTTDLATVAPGMALRTEESPAGSVTGGAPARAGE